MAVRLRRSPGPPSGPFELNEASNQAAGLVLWYPAAAAGAGIMPELANGQHARAGVAGTMEAHPTLGPTLFLPAASSSYLEAGRSAIQEPSTAITIAAYYWLDVNTGHGDGALICKPRGTTSRAESWFFGHPSGGQNSVGYRLTDASGTTAANSFTNSAFPGFFGRTLPLLSVVRWGGHLGTEIQMHTWNLAGTQTNALTGTTFAGPIGYTTDNLRIGRNAGASYGAFHTADVRVYNRALSTAEMWQLYDPATRWELYRPAQRAWQVAWYSAEVQAEAAITLGALTVAATAVAPVAAQASITLGAVTVAAEAVAPVTAQAAVTLGALTVSAAGESTITAAASITLDGLVVAGVAVVLVQGAASITLGTLTLSATAAEAEITFTVAGSITGVAGAGTIEGPSAAGTLRGW